jgi:hypothetical protein
MAIYQIFHHEGEDEICLVRKDHEQHDLLTLTTEGNRMQLSLEFEAVSISFARSIYKAYIESPKKAKNMLMESMNVVYH